MGMRRLVGSGVGGLHRSYDYIGGFKNRVSETCAGCVCGWWRGN